NGGCDLEISGRNQGTAHDAGRRRIPLAQRRAAPATRSVRLRATRALVRGRALTGQGAAGCEHGDLPREYVRHLRRHRVQGALTGSREAHPVSARGAGGAHHPLSGLQRHRHQADLRGRQQASGAGRDRLCHRRAAPERDPGAQGEHHEVHGRRVPRLGLRDGAPGVRRHGARRRPKDYSVIATPTLNGDYISDALAAQVGGIGIAPGANINYLTGHAVFEATHGTAPKYANLDKVNPGSVLLSGEMMLRYMGWTEAAGAIITAMDRTIGQKTVTYDFARLMEGATEVSTSAFGDALIRNL